MYWSAAWQRCGVRSPCDSCGLEIVKHSPRGFDVLLQLLFQRFDSIKALNVS